MWKQIFSQIWNQRRANAWLWIELSIVTVLLWYGVDLVYNYEGAARQPKGYDTSCVFDLTVGTKPLEVINDADNRQVDLLHSRISRLQPFDRAIVLLWLENLNYEEIGQIVGISTKNVSVRLVRIKEQLKSMSND